MIKNELPTIAYKALPPSLTCLGPLPPCASLTTLVFSLFLQRHFSSSFRTLALAVSYARNAIAPELCRAGVF